MLTMLLGGLWHGANWTFVIWGGLHGAWLGLERAVLGDREPRPDRRLLRLWLQRILVFHVVCLAWVFFHATSFGAAREFLTALTTWSWRPEYFSALVIVVLFGGSLLVVDILEERRGEEYLTENASPNLQLGFATAMLAATLLVAASSVSAFIYFQF